MSAPVEPSQDGKRTVVKLPPPRLSRRDREFLPAAREILETPPSVLPVVLTLVICGFVVAALVWAFFGYLDVDATTPGKIETHDQVKVIEPLDPGRVTALHVRNGDHVHIGDKLIELDPTAVAADEDAAANTYWAALAEATRRQTAIGVARKIEMPADGPTLPEHAEQDHSGALH